MTRAGIFTLFTVAVLCLAGCTAPIPDWDLSPLERTARHDSRNESETEAVIPFLHWRTSPLMDEWAFRPLIGYRNDKEEGLASVDFLPPFGRWFSRDKRTQFRFWPLFIYNRRARDQTIDLPGYSTEEIDWMLFPLLFGGRSPQGENYFAFFPLGGRIRNFFTYDTFDFFLWPAYQRVTKTVTDRRASTSIFWLFGWTEGGPRDGSFHFLPFFMKSIWEGKYRKYSVLWPFFHYQENQLHTGHPSRAYGFWPLFHIENGHNYFRHGFIGPVIFLGPLIQCAREVPERWEGRPNVDGKSYYLYDLPWPIVHAEKTRSHEKFRIFPFYSHYQEPGFDSKVFLIPFIWFRNSRNSEYKKSDFFFIPLCTRIHKTYCDGRGSDSYFQLWPLFHREALADGGRDFSLISPMPSRLAKPLEAVERLFWPFWNIYRYRRDDSGGTRHDALFTLISACSDEEATRFSFPLLYSYRNVRSEGWRHNFIWGALSLEGDDSGLKTLKILFIPVFG